MILASVTTTTPTNTMNTFYKNPAPLKDPEIPRTSVEEPRTPVKEPRTLVKEPRTPAEEPRTPVEESRTPRNLEIPKQPRTKIPQVKLGYLGIHEKPEEFRPPVVYGKINGHAA